MSYWVAVYETGREYGGPEEGGWWYDTGRLVASACLDYEADADDIERAFEAAYSGDQYVSMRWNAANRFAPPDYHADVDQDNVLMRYYSDDDDYNRPIARFPRTAPRYE
jgi:hypothetical protein